MKKVEKSKRNFDFKNKIKDKFFIKKIKKKFEKIKKTIVFLQFLKKNQEKKISSAKRLCRSNKTLCFYNAVALINLIAPLPQLSQHYSLHTSRLLMRLPQNFLKHTRVKTKN